MNFKSSYDNSNIGRLTTDVKKFELFEWVTADTSVEWETRIVGDCYRWIVLIN